MYNKKVVTKLERAQKRFMRILPGFEGLSDRKRLGKLELYSLQAEKPSYRGGESW